MVAIRCPHCGRDNSEFDPRCCGCHAPLPAGSTIGTDAPAIPEDEDPLVGREICHFRILEPLGRGGMGVVYRAQDLDLGREVALKLIPPGLADAEHEVRLQREAQSAAALDHPNVGTIYEVGEHQGSHYIAMALYRGETLEQRLGRGAMTVADIRSVVTQVAAALAAAHAAGIVHRDLKPANVMLTDDGRVKLLDFGLARRGDASELTRRGMAMGTVGYMAPEQRRGEPVDHRADLWSLGAMLDDMLASSGRSPPAVLERIRRRCLEQDRDQRFQQAAEILSELRPAVLWRLPVLAVLLLAVVITGLLLVWAGRTPQAAAAVRPSVAVLGFKNLSGQAETAWLSTALAELLSSEMTAGGELRLIPGESVARMRTELSVPETDTLAPDTLRAIGRNLATEYVVSGSFLVLDRQAARELRLLLRLQNTRGGELIAVDESGPEAELSELVARSASLLRRELGVGQPAGSAVQAVQARLSASPEATRLHAEGLSLLHRGDAAAARDVLRRAIAADPGFALAHAALSEAWSVLGHDREARESSRRALELAAGLPPVEVLAIRGRHHETANEWPQALEAYQALWTLFPDDVDCGLRLARAQVRAGRGHQALATVEALRRLPAPQGDDPRIELTEASATLWLKDYQGGLAAAERAVAKAQTRRAWILVAEAQSLKAWALRYLGRFPEALAALEEAEILVTRAERWQEVAATLNSRANMLFWEGHLAESEKLHRQALAIFRRIGNGAGISKVLNNLALAFQQRGKMAAARELFEESLVISREIGNPYQEALRLNNLGWVLLDQGDLAGAARRGQEALLVFESIDSAGGRAENLWLWGDLRFAAGELTAAKASYDEALEMMREIGDLENTAYVLEAIGELLVAMGEPAAAREKLDEARAIRVELGEKPALARVDLARATLLLELGRAAEAEALAREAAAALAGEAILDDQLAAAAVLVRSLLAQGELGTAREAFAAVAGGAEKSERPAVRLAFALAAGRLQAAGGEGDAARRRLQGVLSEAVELGLAGPELEARLVLGELASASQMGRANLAALAEEAAERGFGLIARRARRDQGE